MFEKNNTKLNLLTLNSLGNGMWMPKSSISV